MKFELAFYLGEFLRLIGSKFFIARAVFPKGLKYGNN